MSNIINLFSSSPSLKIGSEEIKKIYIGNKDVSSMYIGNTLIYGLGDTPNIPTEQPIMDGLVYWMDTLSLNHGDNTWNNKVGSGAFAFNDFTYDDTSENGILFSSEKQTLLTSNFTINKGVKEPLSIELFLKITSIGSDNDWVMCIDGWQNGFLLGILGDTYALSGNRTALLDTGVKVVTNEKTQLCIVFNTDNTYSFYINGRFASSRRTNADFPINSKNIVLGGTSPEYPQDCMDGYIYSFRLYNRILTAEEVMENYEYELLPKEELPLIMDGLTCWLDGADLTNGDTVWNDRTNNQNNFQLYNTSSFSYTGKGLKNNSDGYATLSKAITFNEYTIEIKHRRHSWQTDSLLFNAKRSRSNYDIILGYTYSSFYQCYSNSNPKHYEISKDVVPLNEDVTLTWVVRTSERKLYINGVYYASNNSSSGHESVDIASIDLFKYNSVCCDATIYSIKIYNRALSEDEIQKNAEYEDTIDRS